MVGVRALSFGRCHDQLDGPVDVRLGVALREQELVVLRHDNTPIRLGHLVGRPAFHIRRELELSDRLRGLHTSQEACEARHVARCVKVTFLTRHLLSVFLVY